MAGGRRRTGHEESSIVGAHPERPLSERVNRCGARECHKSVHEESYGTAPIMCRTPAASVKATRQIPAFPHNGQHIGLSAVLWGGSTRARPRRLKIARAASISRFLRLFPRMPIVPDTHQSRRQDMQAE